MGVMFESSYRLDRGVRDAYLAKLGVTAEQPSPANLRLLAQRHVERIPYETLWIHAGERWGIDPGEATRRIALEGRGGYCYHLNGAFGLLLASLGYSVHGHVGGVHGPEGPTGSERGNHLVLTVDSLPSDATPDGRWYVDVGLGDALHNPLPLLPGRYDDPPFRLSLERLDGGSSWHLTHDPGGGFTGMSWESGRADFAILEAQHHQLSTSPDSGFVKVAMAERRDGSGVDVVRGLVRSRVGEGAFVAAPVTRRAEWFDLLVDLFDLRLATTDPAIQDRLWANVVATHRRWESEQQ
jgi:arylamine N-acetyltransferase